MSEANPTMDTSQSISEMTEAPEFYPREEVHPENGSLLGFWIYLMSDMLIFAVLFACYAVLGSSYAGAPTAHELFDIQLILISTFFLLFSSITYGFAVLEMQKDKLNTMLLWLGITGLFGVAFVAIEIYEFSHLIHAGATPQASAAWSSFFALVGTHGLHVSFGIVWLVVLMVQVKMYGLTVANRRRLFCLSMFWHFLDLIWIGVFSLVYLTGVLV